MLNIVQIANKMPQLQPKRYKVAN